MLPKIFFSFKFLRNQFSWKQGFYVIFTKILLPLMGSSIRFLTTPIQEKLGKHYMLQPQTSCRCIVTIKTTYKYSIFLHMHQCAKCDSAGDQCLLSTHLNLNTTSLLLYKLKSCFHSGCVTSNVNSMENYCSSNWTSVLEVLHPVQLIIPNMKGSLLGPRNHVEKKKGHLTADKNPLFQPAVFSVHQILLKYFIWHNSV